MQFKEYQNRLINLIARQKILFIVITIILIMALGVAGMSFIGSSASQKAIIDSNGLTQTAALDSQQSSQQSVQLPLNAPSPTNIPLTTKFIYFIGSFFRISPTPTPNPSQYYRSRGRSVTYPTLTAQQNSANNSTNQSGNSGGGGTETSQEPQTGSQQGPSLTPTSTPPPTDIQIVFVNENGEYWTYVPPDVPPVDVTWVKYINYQDHYSIEYPNDWQVVKSNYNGHEGITLYMPGDSDNIDKPSIAFVGWNANYLTSTAKYTGQIILKGTPGTIYTNGQFGPSSVAAVFQYSSGYFALGSTTSNPVFIYIFDHMLRSLEFII